MLRKGGVYIFLRNRLACKVRQHLTGRSSQRSIDGIKRGIVKKMTMKEAGERYQIPLKILKEYESWGLCGAVKKVMGSWQYDDQDIERLGMIMTLHDIGFGSSEVETYMRLVLEGERTEPERIAMLNRRRGRTLDEIHIKEKQIAHMDYLRYEMQKSKKKPAGTEGVKL